MTHDDKAIALRAAFLEARQSDAPVNERLASYAEALRRHFVPYAEAFDRLVARLNDVGAGTSAPKVGEKLPPFLLPDDNGRLVGLDALLERGPLAVVFLRGHWCPYCRLYAHALSQIDEQARSIGRQIIAITPERQVYARQHKAESQAGFRMLCDLGNGYALSLGLAIRIGEEMQELLAGIGRDLPEYQAASGWFVPIPATFVIARSGVITARYVDPDYSRRMDADDLLADISDCD